jgi:hypothetical protein
VFFKVKAPFAPRDTLAPRAYARITAPPARACRLEEKGVSEALAPISKFDRVIV